jgi:hypothetical protein
MIRTAGILPAWRVLPQGRCLFTLSGAPDAKGCALLAATRRPAPAVALLRPAQGKPFVCLAADSG